MAGEAVGRGEAVGMSSLLRVQDIGRRPYRPVMYLQEQLVECRKREEIPDTLLLVEHDPVYTLGRNADAGNVVASPAQLAAMGIEVVEAGRGGDVTYHGPGQLVCYPILDLAARGGKVVAYVGSLEETVVRVLAGFGVCAGLDGEHRGVWVGRDKIAAIGVRITKGITWHGFSVNVSVDTAHYRGIVPCGIVGRGVTSLDRLVGKTDMKDVKARVVQEFAASFSYESVVYA